jgi:ribosome-associated toxin RatA of RatAB toxin-antitoxin module
MVMASATRTEVVDVDINKLYEVIIDYAKYPEFVDGVSAIKVMSQNETSAKVEYSLNIIKSFKYIIT